MSSVEGNEEPKSFTVCPISSGRDTGRGSPRWLRLNVSICRMRSRARVQESRACSRYFASRTSDAAPGASAASTI